jgi:hypothetical protein
MGFQNLDAQSTTWAKIAGGKIVLTSKVALDGYVQRTNKIGNVVYELFFESFEGKLQDIRLVEGEFGPQWHLTFDDNGKTIIITTGYDNRYARTLLNRLLNKAIDFKEKISLKPYSFIPDDKEYTLTGCNVIQYGKKLNPRFDIKTELPQPEETTVKKQKVFNYSKQLEFLEEMIEKELRPRLPKQQAPQVPTDANGFINIEDDIEDKELNFYDGLQD